METFVIFAVFAVAAGLAIGFYIGSIFTDRDK